MPFDSENYQPTDEVLRALQEGRERIATPDKWCRFKLHQNGSVCALGAVYDVRTNAGDFDITDAKDRAAGWLREALAPSWNRLVSSFNNDPSTTHADILALYDRAIAARRAELASELTRAA